METIKFIILQMPKVSIKVVVRVRPITKLITLISNTDKTISLKQPKSNKTYKFDHVCGPHTTQEQLHQEAGIAQLIRHVADGYNSTVFAFGQTSAGKTYTMEGYEYDPKRLKPIIDSNNEGLIQRCIRDIYQQVTKKNNSATLSCSFLQIYNQKLFDLLQPIDADHCLKLRWDKDQQFSVENLSDIICHSDEEMIRIWHEGIKKRVVGSNNLNIASSRSHTIFRINVETVQHEISYVSRLELVDLAGSERSGDSKPTKDSIQINKSLFTLKKVINSLQAQQPYIPYRESKLTSLLKHSVGGNSYCLIIACVNPSDELIEHTISTLNYATKAKTIINSIEQIINSKDKIILQLRQENEVLRQEMRVAQKEIELLTRIQEKKQDKTVRLSKITSPSHLIEIHNNLSPGPEYFSQRLVESINTVRELLKSNKVLRDDLDKEKKKCEEYALQISDLVTQNQHLKSIHPQLHIPSHLFNRSEQKVRRVSLSKILQRERTFRDQLFKTNHKRVNTQQCPELPDQMNISLPRFNRLS